jgi:hypothetical protein
MTDERETERLRRQQAERAAREAELAEQAAEPDEQLAHERRAEKAEYLRSKLEEQAESP